MKAPTLTTQRYGQCISFCGQTNGHTDTLKTIMSPIYRYGGIKIAKFKRQFLNQGSRHFKNMSCKTSVCHICLYKVSKESQQNYRSLQHKIISILYTDRNTGRFQYTLLKHLFCVGIIKYCQNQ